MSDRTASAVVFRFVSPEFVVRLNERLGHVSRPAFWTVMGGFLLYATFNSGGRHGAESDEPIAVWLGFDWLLPYPRLIPLALMAGGVLFGIFKLGLTMVAYSAERRLERDDA